MEGSGYWSNEGYKHPLNHAWTLWYCDNQKTKPWLECLTEVGTFSTVEDFWCLFNHVKPVSGLKSGTDYGLFKDGIRPMWEDEANRSGGRWLIALDKKTGSAKLNQFWLEVAMCMIGECFYGCNELICGATMSIRNKSNKIGLWLRSSDNEREVIHIGLKLRELLGFSPSQVIIYQEHKDNLENNGTSAPKYTYYV